MRKSRYLAILFLAAVLIGAHEANSQWVFVARKAIGRIERLTHDSKDTPGYDVATVVIEGSAEKVYETAIKSIKSAPNLVVRRQDPVKCIIDFTDGSRSAGLKISQVNDTLVQLLIASVSVPGQDSETSLVLSGVIRICKEMGVKYSIEN